MLLVLFIVELAVSIDVDNIDVSDDRLNHLERKFQRIESKLFDLEDQIDNAHCPKITYWKKIYEQSSVSDFAKECDIERCYKRDGNNFIDFRCLENKPEYHFKIIWDSGLHTLEWIQKEHPLALKDKPASLVFIKLDGKDIMINSTPFNGLSISSLPTTALLDGMGGHSNWYYGIGYMITHGGGNAGPTEYPKYGALKTELFIKLKFNGDMTDLYSM